MNFVVLSGQEYIMAAARQAEKNLGWKLHHHYCCQPDIKQLFPDSIAAPYIRACKGDFVYSDIHPRILSAREVDNFAGFEFNAIKMFDRNDSFYDEMNFSERQEVWRLMLGYWVAVFKKCNINLAIFEETPHQVIDYAAYCVAKVKNIKTLIPVRLLPGCGYLLTGRISESVIAGGQNDFGNFSSKKKTKEYYDEFTRKSYFINKNLFWDQTDDSGNISDSISYLKSIAYKIFNVKIFYTYLNNFKTFESDQRQKNVSLLNSDIHYLRFLYEKSKIIYLKHALRKQYNKIATDIPPTTPFVLCALQYQPELSTCPLAGRYACQEHMIAYLADNLPEGWTLLIKEHPSQFVSSYARYGQAFRRSSFYHDILENNENVQFVSQNISIQSLIDASQLVAAPGGSICFEAAVRGKAVINFGGGWFIGCPNVFQIEEIENLEEFIETASDIRDMRGEILDFVDCIDRCAWPGAIGGMGQLEYMGLTIRDNSEIHYKSWVHFWQNFM